MPKRSCVDFAIFEGVGGNIQFYLRFLVFQQRLQSPLFSSPFPHLKSKLNEYFKKFDVKPYIEASLKTCLDIINETLKKEGKKKTKYQFLFWTMWNLHACLPLL